MKKSFVDEAQASHNRKQVQQYNQKLMTFSEKLTTAAKIFKTTIAKQESVICTEMKGCRTWMNWKENFNWN